MDETVFAEGGIIGSLDRIGVLAQTVWYLHEEDDCAYKSCALYLAVRKYLVESF